MIQLIKNGPLTLKEILLKTKEMSLSENIAEQVILFETVLRRIGKVSKIDLSYLDDAHKLIDLGPFSNNPDEKYNIHDTSVP